MLGERGGCHSSGRGFLTDRKSAKWREGARKHESVLLGDQVGGAVPHWGGNMEQETGSEVKDIIRM